MGSRWELRTHVTVLYFGFSDYLKLEIIGASLILFVYFVAKRRQSISAGMWKYPK